MSSDGEFGDFVTARHHALLRTAVLLTGSQHAGEDLLQETLAKTYVVWDRIRRKGAAEAYVRRVLVNTYTSWWRRHRGRRPHRGDGRRHFDDRGRVGTRGGGALRRLGRPGIVRSTVEPRGGRAAHLQGQPHP